MALEQTEYRSPHESQNRCPKKKRTFELQLYDHQFISPLPNINWNPSLSLLSNSILTFRNRMYSKNYCYIVYWFYKKSTAIDAIFTRFRDSCNFGTTDHSESVHVALELQFKIAWQSWHYSFLWAHRQLKSINLFVHSHGRIHSKWSKVCFIEGFFMMRLNATLELWSSVTLN